MVREFALPDVGEGVAEGEPVEWPVAAGDADAASAPGEADASEGDGEAARFTNGVAAYPNTPERLPS